MSSILREPVLAAPLTYIASLVSSWKRGGKSDRPPTIYEKRVRCLATLLRTQKDAAAVFDRLTVDKDAAALLGKLNDEYRHEYMRCESILRMDGGRGSGTAEEKN